MHACYFIVQAIRENTDKVVEAIYKRGDINDRHSVATPNNKICA